MRQYAASVVVDLFTPVDPSNYDVGKSVASLPQATYEKKNVFYVTRTLCIVIGCNKRVPVGLILRIILGLTSTKDKELGWGTDPLLYLPPHLFSTYAKCH